MPRSKEVGSCVASGIVAGERGDVCTCRVACFRCASHLTGADSTHRGPAHCPRRMERQQYRYPRMHATSRRLAKEVSAASRFWKGAERAVSIFETLENLVT